MDNIYNTQSHITHKILLVCDSTYYKYSGGKVARYLCKILEGNAIKIVVTSPRSEDVSYDTFYNEFDVTFISQRDQKRITIGNLLFLTKGLRIFKGILQEFKPDIVHFASFDHVKPAEFIRESKKSGAKIVLQPWTMDFFCASKYGFRDGKQCSLCIKGSFGYSVINRCLPIKHFFSIFKLKRIKKNALLADVVLSSNTDMDNLLIQYGIKNARIVRFPVPFDYSIYKNETSPKDENNNYCIFYGLPTSAKGIDGLISAFSNDLSERIKLFPSSAMHLVRSLPNNIEIENSASWENGLSDAIVSAFAVVVPSLWATTTEYSLCEAMFYRKAVVAFNVGVHKDILRNEENAIVLEPGDFHGLMKAVTRLRKEPLLRKKISENGYRTMLKINDPLRLKDELFKVYFS